jgi:hypothetical protein
MYNTVCSHHSLGADAVQLELGLLSHVSPNVTRYTLMLATPISNVFHHSSAQTSPWPTAQTQQNWEEQLLANLATTQ